MSEIHSACPSKTCDWLDGVLSAMRVLRDDRELGALPRGQCWLRVRWCERLRALLSCWSDGRNYDLLWFAGARNQHYLQLWRPAA
jgi:hypothetical protein